MNIEGKVALVTGGASGLGAATVYLLRRANAKVVLIDLDSERAAKLERDLGDHVAFFRGDVSDPSQMEAAIETTLQKFGRLDIAVNCAGIGGARRILGKEGVVSLDWFTKIVQVNLIGTFNVTRLAAAAMVKNEPGLDGERGVIINTASAAAFDGQIGQAAYSASKGGIVGMTLPLARDLARHGLRVMTIAPGLFDTPLLAQLPEEARAALSETIPFPKRLGHPGEYAQLVKHIVENIMLNGEVIRLDGAIRMPPK